MTLQDTIDTIDSASHIARARAAIDAGTYDTPVVAAITAERLATALRTEEEEDLADRWDGRDYNDQEQWRA